MSILPYYSIEDLESVGMPYSAGWVGQAGSHDQQMEINERASLQTTLKYDAHLMSR